MQSCCRSNRNDVGDFMQYVESIIDIISKAIFSLQRHYYYVQHHIDVTVACFCNSSEDCYLNASYVKLMSHLLIMCTERLLHVIICYITLPP